MVATSTAVATTGAPSPQGFDLPRPSEGAEQTARVTVHQFLSKLATTDELVGFAELVEVGRAAHKIEAREADPKLLTHYNSPLVGAGLRGAVEKAMSLADSIDGMQRGKVPQTLGALSKVGLEIVTAAEGRLDPATLPAETRYLPRYVAAYSDLEEGVSEAQLASQKIIGRDQLRGIALLIELAEAGRSFTLAQLKSPDPSTLECEVARARQVMKRVGGDRTLMGGYAATEAFGYDSVGAILEYARRRGQEVARPDPEGAVQQAVKELSQLAAFSDSPALGPKLRQFVETLAYLAAVDKPRVDGASHEPILGLGRVIRGCLRALDEHAQQPEANPHHDGHVVPAVSGFLAEALVARRAHERGHEVKSLDEMIAFPTLAHRQGPNDRPDTKEVDIVLVGRSASGLRATLFVEVKATWDALARSFEKLEDRQLTKLARIAIAHKAIPALVINDSAHPPPAVVAKLNEVITKVEAKTGKRLVVTDSNFHPIGGIFSANQAK